MQNPYQSPTNAEAGSAAVPSRRLLLVSVAFFVGALSNFVLWWARDHVSRAILFAPACFIGLQDMSDLLLGVLSGATLFAFYAFVLSYQQSATMLVAWTVVLFAGHAICFMML